MLIEMMMFRAAMVRTNDVRSQTMNGPRDFVILPAVASPTLPETAGK